MTAETTNSRENQKTVSVKHRELKNSNTDKPMLADPLPLEFPPRQGLKLILGVGVAILRA
jgi:hypothetical protein